MEDEGLQAGGPKICDWRAMRLTDSRRLEDEGVNAEGWLAED